MKKITIFKYGDGELANQLWNYISVYAYGLEKNIPVFNPSFYEYHSYFNRIDIEHWTVKLMSKLFYNYTGRKQRFWKKLWRKLYRFYPYYIYLTKLNKIISSDNPSNQVVILPPTKHNQVLEELEKQNDIYFDGWLFRNSIGLEKYRKQITIDFCPKKEIVDRIEYVLSTIKGSYDQMIGIHIRKGDYVEFKGGKYIIPEPRIREIINEYTAHNKIDLNKTIFLITSDGNVNPDTFKGLNFYISKEKAVTDLFLLSATNVIIGSDSSFGNFAAWYGNIPHIIMTLDPIDWNYYSFRKEYFENKYCTMVHF